MSFLAPTQLPSSFVFINSCGGNNFSVVLKNKFYAAADVPFATRIGTMLGEGGTLLPWVLGALFEDKLDDLQAQVAAYPNVDLGACKHVDLAIWGLDGITPIIVGHWYGPHAPALLRRCTSAETVSFAHCQPDMVAPLAQVLPSLPHLQSAVVPDEL